MTWRDTILKEFVREAGRLTLVADPDGLLAEEGVLRGLKERGFELLTFEDPVEFRLAYEGRFREAWDRGELTEVVVALRSEAASTDHLPYDLVATGRTLEFSLAELFPLLSPAVLARLDRSLLDEVELAVLDSGLTEERKDAGTREFVLTQVYQWTPALNTPEQLVEWLLKHHYQRREMPAVLIEQAAKALRRKPQFQSWDVERLLADRAAFFAFLQHQWSAFLDRQSGRTGLGEPTTEYAAGGPTVDLNRDVIRPWLDNCFSEGLLQPVEHPAAAHLLRDQGKGWMAVGLRTAPRLEALTALMQRTSATLPGAESQHQEWLSFGLTWAAVRAGVAGLPTAQRSAMQPALTQLREQVDDRFRTWALDRFGLLASLPPSPPVLVHHIPRWLAQHREANPTGRQALVVLDGLALDQWLTIKQHLAQHQPTWSWHDHTALAWVPTLTKVSRLAIFTGLPPVMGGIDGTIDLEERCWRRFWMDRGLTSEQVVYGNYRLLNLHADQEIEEFADKCGHAQVAGLVVRAVDELMHSTSLGEASLGQQVQQWLELGYLERLLLRLMTLGFDVLLTSDHGNTEATGVGKPQQGVLVDERGERACLYTDPLFRTQALHQIPSAFAWSDVGLPPKVHYLLAGGRSAFLPVNDSRVVHGGLTLDEVLVPCVLIRRGPAA